MVDQLRKNRGQQIHRPDDQEGRQPFEPRRDGFDDQVDRARCLQCCRHREHSEDQRQEAAVDHRERLVCVDAAGEKDKGDGDDRQRQYGRDAEGRQQHDPGQRGIGDGRMFAAVGARRRRRDIHQIGICRQSGNVIGRTFQKQRIAHAHDQIVKLGSNVLVAPVNRQNVDAIAPPKPELPERTTDQRRPGRNQHLDRAGLARGELVDGADIRACLKAQKLFHLRPQNHPVAGFERHGGDIAAQRGVAPQNIDHAGAFAPEYLHLADRFADQFAVLGHRDLGEKLFLRTARQKRGHAGAVRQQARGHEAQVERAPDDQEHRERCDLEDREWLQPARARDAIDQKVGRGADQRQGSAQDCGIGKRDQQFAGGKPELFRKLHEDRDHHQNHGRVIHEGRGDDDQRHQPADGKRGVGVGLGLRKPGEAFERAGAHQRPHHDEHRRDGPGCGVREHGQSVVIGQHAKGEKRRRTGDRNHLGGIGFADEQREHHRNHADGEHGLNFGGKFEQMDHCGQTLLESCPAASASRGRGSTRKTPERIRTIAVQTQSEYVSPKRTIDQKTPKPVTR